jgi:hypothetical protein
MAMEEPEFPPVSVNERQATIGEYYRAIQKKISELGDGIFVVGAGNEGSGAFREGDTWEKSGWAGRNRERQSTSACMRCGDPATIWVNRTVKLVFNSWIL